MCCNEAKPTPRHMTCAPKGSVTQSRQSNSLHVAARLFHLLQLRAATGQNVPLQLGIKKASERVQRWHCSLIPLLERKHIEVNGKWCILCQQLPRQQ